MSMLEESTRKDITSGHITSGLIAAALVIAGLIYGHVVHIPLSLAAILAFVLALLVYGLTRFRVPHGAAVPLALIACLSLASVGSGVFSRQNLTLTASLEIYKGNLSQKLHTFSRMRANGGQIERGVASIDQFVRQFERLDIGPE